MKLLVLLSIASLVVGCGQTDKPGESGIGEQLGGNGQATHDSSPAVVPMEIDLATLLADTRSGGNEIARDKKYNGRVVRTRGILRHVSSGGKEIEPGVIVGVYEIWEESYENLTCYLAEEAVDEAASLKIGEEVVIQGQISGFIFGVTATDCVFVKPASATTDAAAAPKGKSVAEVEKAIRDQAATEAVEWNDETVKLSRERYCTTMYRGLTVEDMSPEAIGEYKSKCPGYDLPVAWQRAAANSAARLNSAPPTFEFGDDYGAVREEMMRAGWEPYTVPNSDECGGDSRCDGRPEMEACSGTGIAVCSFNWRKNGTVVSICTHGEETARFHNYCS